MQSATVVHAVEHTEAEHTEHCAAFITADQAADCHADLVSLDSISFTADWFQLYFPSIQARRLHHLSRAPPVKRTV